MENLRVIVLGSTGMLGHKLVQTCATRFETVAVSRGELPGRLKDLLPNVTFRTGVDAADLTRIRELIESLRPSAVVNCIGIVKQLAAAKAAVPSITINALFPHQLAGICAAAGVRLIHISTDCVFRGTRGSYAETDAPDADDLYGRTKLLGEIDGPGCLTLRTSIIGREIQGTSGLVEWFLAQRGSAKGYTKAFFSGLTTIGLSELIASLLADHPDLNGLWHVSAERISKYDLLALLDGAYEKGIELIPGSSVVIDRSLDSGRFRATTGFQPQSWPDMIARLAEDTTPYEVIRSS